MSTLSASISIAQRAIVQYCYTSILVFSVVGSLMNILLFSRRHLRVNPCCTYFLAASCSALLLVSIGIIPQLYALYNTPNPFTSIPSFCKARSYLNQTSAMSCRWLLVMASLDRFISCSSNSNVRRFSTVRMSHWIIVIIVAVWHILPVHMLVFSNIQPPGNIQCSVTDETVALYHRFYTIIMGGALPATIAGVASLLTWRSVRDRSRQRMIISNSDVERRRRVRDQQVLFMLWMQVIILIISAIPFMSFNIYDTMTRSTTNKSADRKAIEGLSKTLMEMLIYLITLSFYSNTLVSRTFRKELLVLLKTIGTCGRYDRQQRVRPWQETGTKSVQMQTKTRTTTTTMPAIAFISSR